MTIEHDNIGIQDMKTLELGTTTPTAPNFEYKKEN